MCVRFSRRWRAEEWEVRISRKVGGWKGCRGMMKWGWYGLFSRLRCTPPSTHAYVRYTGVTRYRLRPVLIGRVEQIFSTSHSFPLHLHLHSRCLTADLLSPQRHQWLHSPSECQPCRRPSWKWLGMHRPLRPRMDSSRGTRWLQHKHTFSKIEERRKSKPTQAFSQWQCKQKTSELSLSGVSPWLVTRTFLPRLSELFLSQCTRKEINSLSWHHQQTELFTLDTNDMFTLDVSGADKTNSCGSVGAIQLDKWKCCLTNLNAPQTWAL